MSFMLFIIGVLMIFIPILHTNKVIIPEYDKELAACKGVLEVNKCLEKAQARLDRCFITSLLGLILAVMGGVYKGFQIIM